MLIAKGTTILIPQIKIKKEVRDQSNVPYLAHLVVLSQLLYLLFSETIESALFFEFSPLTVLSFFLKKQPVPTNQETQEKPIETEDFFPSSIENLAVSHFNSVGFKTNVDQSVPADVFLKFLMANESVLLDLSSQSFDKIKILFDAPPLFALDRYKSDPKLVSIFSQCFKLIPAYKIFPVLDSTSFFTEFTNSNFLLTIGTKSIHIRGGKFVSNLLKTTIELDALTALCRKIILLSLIHILSEKKGFCAFHYGIFEQLVMFHLNKEKNHMGDSFRSVPHVKFSISGEKNEENCILPLDTFKVLYGYAFTKIESNESSIEIRFDEKIGRIKIKSILDQNFLSEILQLKPIVPYVFNAVLKDVALMIEEVLKTIQITPHIPELLLRNCLSQELSKMMNLAAARLFFD